MGRGQNEIQAADAFQVVIGNRRGAQRDAEAFLAGDEILVFSKRGLKYRIVRRPIKNRRFHASDLEVEKCERCGVPDHLLRDWDDSQIPALCCNNCLFSDGKGRWHTDCEDWCELEVEHQGLCAPKRF